MNNADPVDFDVVVRYSKWWSAMKAENDANVGVNKYIYWNEKDWGQMGV